LSVTFLTCAGSLCSSEDIISAPSEMLALSQYAVSNLVRLQEMLIKEEREAYAEAAFGSSRGESLSVCGSVLQ